MESTETMVYTDEQKQAADSRGAKLNSMFVLVCQLYNDSLRKGIQPTHMAISSPPASVDLQVAASFFGLEVVFQQDCSTNGPGVE